MKFRPTDVGWRRPACTALLALASGPGCADSGTGAFPDDLNVLLIVVDTVGAEYLGCHQGGTRTPRIDQLARTGVRFENAFSTAPWTKPSMASMFTSRMPSRHGVKRLNDALPPEAETLAEIAREAGLRTHGVISHFLLMPPHGYDQGFDGYDVGPIAGHDGVCGEKVSDAAVSFLENLGDERFFLFVHYFDPHFLYHSHPDYPHAPEGYAGRVQTGMDIWELRDMRSTLAAPDIEQLKGLYREEIAYTDHQIGRVLDALERSGRREKTLVILTADHGEELMGHGWIGHTRTLYDELINVPLIVALPGTFAPGVETAPVSILDIAPTVAQALGARPRPQFEGRTLLPYLRAPSTSKKERLIFAEVSFGQRDPAKDVDARKAQKAAHKTAVVLGDLKLIHDERLGRFELYDRASDPHEQHNLWTDPMAHKNPLYESLMRWEATRSDGSFLSGEVPFSAEDLEELRKLGYVK